MKILVKMGTITKKPAAKPVKNAKQQPGKKEKTNGKLKDPAHNHDILDGLRVNFGFEQFKGRQEEAINSLLNGRDTFVIMPTGGGKSLCYQLPAMILEGCAII